MGPDPDQSMLVEFTREEMICTETMKQDIARHKQAGVTKYFPRAKVREVAAVIDRLVAVWIEQTGEPELERKLHEEYVRALEDEDEDGGLTERTKRMPSRTTMKLRRKLRKRRKNKKNSLVTS